MGTNTSSCGDCNYHQLMADREYVEEDLNVLNFERVKWGGVRLNDLLYCWLDLELLSREETMECTDEDVAILYNMLEAIRSCADNESARMLEKRWKNAMVCSKQERDVVMEVWGYAGLLTRCDTPHKHRGAGHDFNSVSKWQGDDTPKKRLTITSGLTLFRRYGEPYHPPEIRGSGSVPSAVPGEGG